MNEYDCLIKTVDEIRALLKNAAENNMAVCDYTRARVALEFAKKEILQCFSNKE